ncbi:MAG: FtsX-like permease family protein, partial [bacterium]|nr:FtsX-like permease family protein [bacterium]
EEGGRRTRVAYATDKYFHVLGAPLKAGRGFRGSKYRGPGQHPVAVVSYEFWRKQLSGRLDVLDTSILLDDNPYTIIGVAAEDFKGARVNRSSVDVWVPLSQHPDAAGDESLFKNREKLSVQVLGRLRSNATLSEARAAVQTVFASLSVEYPETNHSRMVKAVSFGRFPAQNRLYDVIAAVGIAGLMTVLLLIICGNLAGMALARSAGREQEIGVRLALGSSRIRLVRQLMLEALVLCVIGGGIGIVLAMTAMTLVSPMDLGISAPGATFEPSGWTLAMSLALSLIAGHAFGFLPALRFSRPELVSALKDNTGGGGRREGKLQRCAATFQIGIAFLLLLMAALFLRSLDRIDASRIGFRPEGLAVTDFRSGGPFLGFLDPVEVGYPSLDEGGATLLDQLQESIGSVPGVASATVASGFPLDRRRTRLTVSRADQESSNLPALWAEFTVVSEGYFSTVGIPIVQGRTLLRTDDKTAPRVAIISRSLANRLWPGENAIGRQFVPTNAGIDVDAAWTVVGVTGHVSSSVVTEDLPQVFFPLRQTKLSDFVILVRGVTDLSSLTEPIQRAIRSVDPGLPVPRLLPARSLVTLATQEQRTGGQVAGGIGLLVLLLSAMGIHGVVSLAVTNRAREFGLRLALGASRWMVARSVLVDALRTSAPGLLVGGLLAVATAATMRSMLLGLSPVDPVSFFSAGVLLLAVVVTSSLSSALRASTIHPMEALRKD